VGERDISWLNEETIDNVVALRDRVCTLRPVDQHIVIRRLKGDTQGEIAQGLGVSDSTLSRRLASLLPGFRAILHTRWQTSLHEFLR
jgi:hypothetical protein